MIRSKCVQSPSGLVGLYWVCEPGGAGAGRVLLAGLVGPAWLALAGTAAAAIRAVAVRTPLSTPIFLIISGTFRGMEMQRDLSLVTPR
jgi:hypothetical protein